MIKIVLVVVLTLIILILCGWLIWSKKYEDGVGGRIGLGIILLSMIVTLVYAREERLELALDFLPQVIFVYLGLAIFLARHAWNFVKFTRFPRSEVTVPFKGVAR